MLVKLEMFFVFTQLKTYGNTLLGDITVLFPVSGSLSPRKVLGLHVAKELVYNRCKYAIPKIHSFVSII